VTAPHASRTVGARRGVPGRTPAVHLRPVHIALVAVGGTAGTAARQALSLAVPPVGGVPVAILGINLVGAFLLGLLLEALARRGPDAGRRRHLRLLLGTGFCGGFTTYSSLAATSAMLLATGATGAAVLYGLATVVVGGVATWAGIACGALGRGR
jgi:CrcB protein